MVRIRRIGAVVSVVLMGGALLQPANGHAELSESKRKAIGELLEIVGVVGMAEQMRDQQAIVELMRMQSAYAEMIDYMASEQAELSESDRQLLLARFEDFDAFAERFRARFNERLDFVQIIETVYLPIYDQYFSEEDLRAMLAFYRTPVGRKSIEVMPALMQQAAAGIEETVRPLSIGLIEEIVAEEAAKLAD